MGVHVASAMFGWMIKQGRTDALERFVHGIRCLPPAFGKCLNRLLNTVILLHYVLLPCRRFSMHRVRTC